MVNFFYNYGYEALSLDINEVVRYGYHFNIRS